MAPQQKRTSMGAFLGTPPKWCMSSWFSLSKPTQKGVPQRQTSLMGLSPCGASRQKTRGFPFSFPLKDPTPREAPTRGSPRNAPGRARGRRRPAPGRGGGRSPRPKRLPSASAPRKPLRCPMDFFMGKKAGWLTLRGSLPDFDGKKGSAVDFCCCWLTLYKGEPFSKRREQGEAGQALVVQVVAPFWGWVSFLFVGFKGSRREPLSSGEETRIRAPSAYIAYQGRPSKPRPGPGRPLSPGFH